MSDRTRLTADELLSQLHVQHERNQRLDLQVSALRTELAQAQQKIDELQRGKDGAQDDRSRWHKHWREAEAELAKVAQEREKLMDDYMDLALMWNGAVVALTAIKQERLCAAPHCQHPINGRAVHADCYQTVVDALAALKPQVTAENIQKLYADAHEEWQKRVQYISDVEFDVWVGHYIKGRIIQWQKQQ